MFNTPLFLLPSMVLINLTRALSSHVTPDVEVISPSEFNLILPPEEKGTLTNIRISINKPIEFSIGDSDYIGEKKDDRVIRFSEKGLNLMKGDTIYYSLMFSAGKGKIYGQAGTYVFDGVYKNQLQERDKREVYEINSEVENLEEEIVQDSDSIKTKDHGRRLRHEHRPPPHGHFSHHGHYDPHQFAAPPYGHAPPHGSGPWNGHGHDHKDRDYGNDGPWNENDDENCDYGGNIPKYPGGNQGRGKKRPFGGNNDNPYSGNNGGNIGGNNGGNNGGSNGGNNIGHKDDNPYTSKRPNKGTGFGNDNPYGSNENNDFDKNGGDSNKNNRSTDNPNVEVFTTRRPSTTLRTTTVPNIDIRFRLPEDS